MSVSVPHPVTTADQILAAAEALLISSADIDAVSVRQIADIAGVNASLGIRTSIVHDRTRLTAMVGAAFDLNDPDEIIAMMVSFIAPMFRK